MGDFLPEQCRAARAFLGWSQQELANRAKVAQKTVADFETGDTAPRATTLDKMRATLEKAGATFLDATDLGHGLRVKRRK